MELKLIEIRDRETSIPALAVRLSKDDHPLVWRAGYGSEPSVILINLDTGEARNNPYDWPNFRPMGNAHSWLLRNWMAHDSGVALLRGHTAERCDWCKGGWRAELPRR